MFRKLREMPFFQTFFATFNLHDEKAFGRSILLGSLLMTGVINGLCTGGTFYTAFLTANNFSIVDTGYLTVFSTLASLILVLFSPIIMDRVMRWKRGPKYFLCGMRLLAYTINIIGLTLTTLYVKDQQTKYILFIVISFSNTAINTLIQPGITTWHANFIADQEARARYMSISQILNMLCSNGTLILSGLVADAIRGTEYEVTVLSIVRIVGFVFAVIEVILLMLPKEYPYVTTDNKVHIKYIFLYPLRNKKYMRTMLIIILWTLSTSLSSNWMYYVMNSIRVKITVINLVNFSYAFIQILFMAIILRIVNRLSWGRAWGVFAVFQGLSDVFLSFTGLIPAYTTYFIIIRLIQHVIGVGVNLCYANLPYLNTPEENRNYYFSFYHFILYLFTAIGQYLGTTLIKIMDQAPVTLFGKAFETPALVKCMEGCFCICIAIYALCSWKTLQTDEEKARSQRV